ncbi:helix-turn-helix domain-containing protein [Nocardiopsis xinjiangensis]|uniref:helix-turn-helix domain-containing protein n=1 Tax=Nocardiopsis xinjiangensis TaxID=124285 RepID=UPI0009FFF426|nr:helix-turn-helix transcriptional regulator [Nocardiopsis xinjiangensis]
MPTSYSPSIRRRRLSSELRRLRAETGFTIAEAAKHADLGRSNLGKMEQAESKTVPAAALDKLLNLYEVHDTQTREALHALAQDAKQRGWWSKYKGLFDDDRALPDFEAEASTIRTFEALCIPGLLQTPEYSHALFEGGRYTSLPEIEQRVAFRMARREVLNRVQPARLRAVLDEAALRRVIGGPEVMQTQLMHLLHMAEMPHVDVQVIPFRAGSHAGLTAPFAILDFPDPRDSSIVYVGTIAGSVFFEQEDEVERYDVTYGDLQGSALSTKQSATLIQEIANSLRE